MRDAIVVYWIFERTPASIGQEHQDRDRFPRPPLVPAEKFEISVLLLGEYTNQKIMGDNTMMTNMLDAVVI